MENRRKIIQGEPFSVAFFHVALPIEHGPKYRITKEDIVEFTIGRAGRRPIVRLTAPGRIIHDVDNTFLVHLTAKETARIPCLLYDMRLAVDLKGRGEEVYTIVNEEVEVAPK